MKRTKHRPEQIIKKLREAVAMLAVGKTIGQVAQALEISEQTYYRWRQKYGSMQPEMTKELKALQKENARLKRLVANQALDIEILKEAAKGNG